MTQNSPEAKTIPYYEALFMQFQHNKGLGHEGLYASHKRLLAALAELSITLKHAADNRTETPSQADWRDFARAHYEMAQEAIAKATGKEG